MNRASAWTAERHHFRRRAPPQLSADLPHCFVQSACVGGVAEAPLVVGAGFALPVVDGGGWVRTTGTGSGTTTAAPMLALSPFFADLSWPSVPPVLDSSPVFAADVGGGAAVSEFGPLAGVPTTLVEGAWEFWPFCIRLKKCELLGSALSGARTEGAGSMSEVMAGNAVMRFLSSDWASASRVPALLEA